MAVRTSGVGAWIALSVLAFACHRDSDARPDRSRRTVEAPSVDRVRAACVEAQEAYCELGFRCNPGLASSLGSLADCKKAAASTCDAYARLPDLDYDETRHQACLAEARASSCATWPLESDHPHCHFPGKRPLGAPCVEGDQCAEGRCRRARDAACGECARLDEGAICTTSCEGDLACGSGFRCVRPESVGGDCHGLADCRYGLDCVGGKCVEEAKVGEACDPMSIKAPRCDVKAASSCVAGACVAMTYANVGDPCDVKKNLCAGGSCIAGRCVAFPTKGAKCVRGCAFPYRCVDRVCVLALEATCN